MSPDRRKVLERVIASLLDTTEASCEQNAWTDAQRRCELLATDERGLEPCLARAN
jgi:hypothetical protein